MIYYRQEAIVLQGGLTSHFFQNGGDAYEKEEEAQEQYFSYGIADFWHIPSGITYICVYIL